MSPLVVLYGQSLALLIGFTDGKCVLAGKGGVLFTAEFGTVRILRPNAEFPLFYSDEFTARDEYDASASRRVARVTDATSVRLDAAFVMAVTGAALIFPWLALLVGAAFLIGNAVLIDRRTP